MNNGLPEQRFENNFTLLRHIAAICVIIGHSYGLLNKYEEEPLAKTVTSQTSIDQIGLSTFFFISGFLVTQSYFFSKGLLHFFWKRILRIYPALIVLIVITTFIVGPIFTSYSIGSYFKDSVTWNYFWGGITLIKLRFFLPGVFNEHGVNGSLWSLPVEFRLYLILGFSLLLFLKRRKLFIPGIWIVFLIVGFLVEHFSSIYLLTIYFHWWIFFFTGVFCFFYRENIKLNYLLSILLLIVWVFASQNKIANTLSLLLFVSYGSLVVAFKMPVVFPVFFERYDFSYSLYIYAFVIQQILIHSLAQEVLSPFLLTMMTMLILIPISWLSWRFIESPFLKWKDRLVK